MEELSTKTVQQYAALVSRIARDRALPITRGRSAWGRVRAALLWAVNFNRGNRSPLSAPCIKSASGQHRRLSIICVNFKTLVELHQHDTAFADFAVRV